MMLACLHVFCHTMSQETTDDDWQSPVKIININIVFVFNLFVISLLISFWFQFLNEKKNPNSSISSCRCSVCVCVWHFYVLGVSSGRTRWIRKWFWELWGDWTFEQRPGAQEVELGKKIQQKNTTVFVFVIRSNWSSMILTWSVCSMCVLFQVQAASVLFVDNPVGTGFSYTERSDGYATNVAMVSSDMLVLLGHFFAEKPEFQVIWRFSHDGQCCVCGPVERLWVIDQELTDQRVSLHRTFRSTSSLSPTEGRWQLPFHWTSPRWPLLST